MEKPLIEPEKLAGDPEINGPCLLLINPFEAHYASTQAKKRDGLIHRLFHCQLMSFDKEGVASSYWAGPSVGAPMAVITMEKLIALGCKKLVAMAWCGALIPELKVGDIFLPTWGESEEGVSGHYPVAAKAQAQSSLLTKLQDHFPTAKQGPIWTTDAPYRELPSKIKQFANEGIKAVDMEFSALSTVAAFRNIEFAAIMLVSDELYHETWQAGYTGKKFKKKSREVFESLSQLLPNL